MAFSEKLKNLKNAINLYVDIKNKNGLSDETVKAIGIYHLHLREREKASSILDNYLKVYPDDGEAISYLLSRCYFNVQPGGIL